MAAQVLRIPLFSRPWIGKMKDVGVNAANIIACVFLVVWIFWEAGHLVWLMMLNGDNPEFRSGWNGLLLVVTCGIGGSILWAMQAEGALRIRFWGAWYCTIVLLVSAPFVSLSYWTSIWRNDTLGVEKEHVRLLDDGTLLHAGEFVPHDVRQEGGLVTPLQKELTVVLKFSPNTGYEKHTSVKAKIHLDAYSPHLPGIIREHWNTGVYLGQSKRIFQPVIEQLFEEFQTGHVPGDDLSLRLRAGDILNQRGLPPGVRRVEAVSLSLDGWALERR